MSMRSIRSLIRQRGSALLVTLMVVVGLSLLGLGFVAISETETAISINQRNHAQTVAVAESAARTVVEWFQNPGRARSLNLMPANNNILKTERTVDAYIGYYKPTTTNLLCDLPFGPAEENKFYGDEDHADVIIEASNAATFLAAFNDQLFSSDSDSAPIVVTSIRIYAPPIVGGTLVDGFFIGGQRYGVATVRAIAEKYASQAALSSGDNPIARGVVKMVLAPFPLPGPTGALQSGAVVETTGDMEVWWGQVTSDTTTYIKRPKNSSIPWFNAWERIHFERGYDSSTIRVNDTAYQVGSIIRLPNSITSLNPALQLHEYVAISATGTRKSAAIPPGAALWPTASGGTIVDGEITWQERVKTAYRIENPAENNQPWLYEVVNTTVEDPWFTVRARGAITGKGAVGGAPHPFDYVNPGDSFQNTEWFQNQSFNNRPEYKDTKFPVFDYDFWKGVATAGNGTGNIYYLSYDDASSLFTNGVTSKSLTAWVISGPGFYFFDTKNELNPQNGGPGVLTDEADPCSGGSMRGFVYANAESLYTTGACDGIAGNFPQPGEPYRDIGYRKVTEATVGINIQGNFFKDASGAEVYDGAVNQEFSFQDLSWSNTGATSGGTKNELFDIFLAQRTVDYSGGTRTNEWLPVPYTPGCKPGNNSCGTCNCSEPHEPFLNIKYSAAISDIGLGWQDPSTEVRRAKKTTDLSRTAALVSCTSTSSQADCTSNAYDKDGGLVPMTVDLDGVLYNEGLFDAKGNANYFGSVLAEVGVDVKGTLAIYFDENLIKGAWPPPGLAFPRVFITSIEADQN